MKCTTCGYETQPGAKFCVQCGTTIVAASAPAGMAPLAGPSVTSRLAPAPAASATAARPAYAPSPATATAARPAYTPSPATATAARPAYTPAPGGTQDPGAVAAAPASSMRLGLIAGLLALIAAVGIGSFIAYKMLIAVPPKEPVTATETPKPVERPTTAPAADASKDGAAPANAAGGAPMNNMSAQPTPAATPAATPSPGSTTATAARPPDASKTATGAAVTPKSGAGSAQTKAGAPAKADAPTTGAPAASPSRQAATPAPAAPPAPPVQVDRWALMRQAHEACNNESLFERLGCHHRVGQQYCKGYWGTVPECPAGTYGDRANQ